MMHKDCWWCDQGYTHAPMIYPKFIPFEVQPKTREELYQEKYDAWYPLLHEVLSRAFNDFGEASGHE